MRNIEDPSANPIKSLNEKLKKQACNATESFTPSCLLRTDRDYWIAVKELNFSHYIGEATVFPMYTDYGNSM